MTPRDWAEHLRRGAEDADCEHDAFMCQECFYAMVERSFKEALEPAVYVAKRLAAADGFTTVGSLYDEDFVAALYKIKDSIE